MVVKYIFLRCRIFEITRLTFSESEFAALLDSKDSDIFYQIQVSPAAISRDDFCLSEYLVLIALTVS